ncbi:D-alanine--poly(phosphoribitol) ligase subunit 2 [Harryflintia acetispora]|uniref:D-alanine--poly(phosphoribitol) ligase subunit 2 n=1 Tax=Harryflintia acetispora TaxID=1849041 RepID=UPI0018972F19|nr:D-alanine--poly(phosphoribitol) ligase subunit 2 [Harryflintia acetispora]
MDEQRIERKVNAILTGLCGAEDGELEFDLDLFEAGLLDSFGVIQLLLELEDAFGISLQIETIPRERISTPERIAALVREASE